MTMDQPRPGNGISTVSADAPVLRAWNLGKEFPGKGHAVAALADVSLELHAGEVVAIVGRSGSGKTTLLQILGLLSKPSSGSLELLNAPVASLRSHEQAFLRRRHLGFVFQSFNLLPQLSAIENVELPMLGDDVSGRARALLESLGMGDRLRHRPSELSAGEQQRVSVARALANDPEIILADEPSGNLDPTTESEMLSLLRAAAARGRAVLVVTHSPAVAAAADRVITLVSGRVAVDDAQESETQMLTEVAG